LTINISYLSIISISIFNSSVLKKLKFQEDLLEPVTQCPVEDCDAGEPTTPQKNENFDHIEKDNLIDLLHDVGKRDIDKDESVKRLQSLKRIRRSANCDPDAAAKRKNTEAAAKKKIRIFCSTETTLELVCQSKCCEKYDCYKVSIFLFLSSC